MSSCPRERYSDVMISAMASQITSLPTAHWTACSGADQRKHQSPASLAFVLGIHWWPVNSPHKWPVTRKMFPFDDVIMNVATLTSIDSTWTTGVGIIKWVFRVIDGSDKFIFKTQSKPQQSYAMNIITINALNLSKLGYAYIYEWQRSWYIHLTNLR